MNKCIYGDTVGGGGGNIKKVPQSDWAQTDDTKLDFIKNKPIGLATMDWVREFVYSMLTIGYAITENDAGGFTYDIAAYRYTIEENDSGGNTITITGGV
jgi:hypothetical protein